MNLRTLTYKSLIWYARYYKLVAVAVLITVSVIVGSLVVGDSVRSTLEKRVTERLGNTESILFARNGFLSETLMKTPLFSDSAEGVLLTNGFISQNGKLIPVYVWGIPDSLPCVSDTISDVSEAILASRLERRGGPSLAMVGRLNTIRVNPPLARELGVSTATDLVLRLPATGLVPSGSLFVTENYTTSLRLRYDGVVDAASGGNISMKNEQVLPFNVFVNRNELAEALEVPSKINLILNSRKVTEEGWNDIWTYTASGLFVHPHNGYTEIRSDRVFLQQEVVETICRNNHDANRLFSYLANSIESGNQSVPYSFVTAMDRYKETTLSKDEAILSDYTARRLHAQVGDTVRLTYYTSKDLKTLVTDTASFRVQQIVPLTELQADPTLSADFPGLSDVERCTDWDSDLPINMNLITDEDERYWELYRSTPKAIISYEAVAGDWGNNFGTATAIRVAGETPDLTELRPAMFDIQLIHPREAGLHAARNGVNFSGLFLALGFFIILSAMLLMLVPLSEMLYQRRPEIELLQALGYPRKRIIRQFWRESMPVVAGASVVGVIAGLLYTAIVVWLLGNVWKGATQTDGFAVYPTVTTLLTSLLIGFLLSLGLLRIAITRALKEKVTYKRLQARSLKRKRLWVILSTVLAVAIIAANWLFLQSVALFVTVGVVLIGTATLWGDYLISRNTSFGSVGLTSAGLVWGGLLANRKQQILSFFTLTVGVFIVFSVGLNRQSFADSSQLQRGTGGYTLWCESSIPVYHNLATQSGRNKLALTDLPAQTQVLQCLRYNADDASCLNLNKVSTPSVLGVDMQALVTSGFDVTQSIFDTDREGIFAQLQTVSDRVYPALVDATVLQWSLGLSLGDTLYYEGDNGQRVAILLAGTLPNTIFQGHILIDRSLFSDIWGEITGSEVFLLKVDADKNEEVKTLLSQALNEYGVRVSTTNDRLKQFNVVTDTYLTIFMTLGGFGLLLGLMSFMIVIRKNLVMRRREIGLYRTLGFTADRIEYILYRENILVPLYAIATGVIASLVGVSISFMNTGVGVWLLALFFTLFFVVCVLFFVRRSVRHEVQSFIDLS